MRATQHEIGEGISPTSQSQFCHGSYGGDSFRRKTSTIHHCAVENLYSKWPSPICIISDGPYGLNGFPGDLRTSNGLVDWYRPHVEAWTARATPQTTLWFWNSELGWATVHPLFAEFGWEYRSCHIWDKGLGHIAGNANTRTLRKFPVVTEVCTQYVKAPTFRDETGKMLNMRRFRSLFSGMISHPIRCGEPVILRKASA